MLDRENIKKFLSEDIYRNIQFIYSLERESFKCIKQIGKSFLFNNNPKSFTIYSSDSEELNKLIDYLPKEKHRISNVENWIAESIIKRRKV